MTKKEEVTGGDAGLFIAGIMLGVLFTIIVVGIFGFFDSPMDSFGFAKDDLAKYHVLKHYPEYENCNFKYLSSVQIDCEQGIAGVEVFCGNEINRDGMSELINNPDLTLCFDEVDFDKVLKDMLSECK